MQDRKDQLKGIFTDVFENPTFDIEVIKQHFHSDYIQHVDGKILNFDQFVQHMKALKNCTIK